MKNNKKLLVIIGSLVLVLLLGIGIYFMFFNKTETEEKQKGEETKVEDNVVAPASNTEELLEEMELVEIESVTADEIVFSDDVDLKENEKVAVWVYSKPKFLGYFEVLVEDGVKKIVGLKEALKNISIEEGDHNIAITTESGDPIGYIDVYIEDGGKLSESVDTKDKDEDKKESEEKEEVKEDKKEEKTTTKEVTEIEEINFGTTKQNEVNMLKGTTKVVQEGKKGEKKVTYKVTYDSNGKEIKREKKSEKTTKEPTNQIEKVGTSDFNMNSDMLTEVSWGPMCTQLNASGDCDEGTLSYTAIKINTTYYLTSITENGSNIFTGLIQISGTEGVNLIATYNGTKYYCYMSAGGGQYELLTEEICSKYSLNCGRW